MENEECSRGGVLLKILKSVPLSNSAMVAGSRAPYRMVECRDTVKLVNPFDDRFNNSVRLNAARMRLAQGIRPSQVSMLCKQTINAQNNLTVVALRGDVVSPHHFT